MDKSTIVAPQAPHQRTEVSRGESADAAWKSLCRAGAAAALLSVGCIAVAIVIAVASPPPTTVTGWFALIRKSGLLGVLDLDLMMLVSYTLMGVIYLALFGALRHINEPFMALAAVCGFASIVTYFASNPAFNMLWLSGQYTGATTEAQRSQFLAAGQTALALWQGTALDVSYVLAAIATLIIATVMLHSSVFGKATSYAGLLLGALTIVPATAGTMGLVLSFVALVPTVVWLVLIARGLFRLSDTQAPAVSSSSGA